MKTFGTIVVMIVSSAWICLVGGCGYASDNMCFNGDLYTLVPDDEGNLVYELKKECECGCNDTQSACVTCEDEDDYDEDSCTASGRRTCHGGSVYRIMKCGSSEEEQFAYSCMCGCSGNDCGYGCL
jgi:hypothetical protein